MTESINKHIFIACLLCSQPGAQVLNTARMAVTLITSLTVPAGAVISVNLRSSFNKQAECFSFFQKPSNNVPLTKKWEVLNARIYLDIFFKILIVISHSADIKKKILCSSIFKCNNLNSTSSKKTRNFIRWLRNNYACYFPWKKWMLKAKMLDINQEDGSKCQHNFLQLRKGLEGSCLASLLWSRPHEARPVSLCTSLPELSRGRPSARHSQMSVYCN